MIDHSKRFSQKNFNLVTLYKSTFFTLESRFFFTNIERKFRKVGVLNKEKQVTLATPHRYLYDQDCSRLLTSSMVSHPNKTKTILGASMGRLQGSKSPLSKSERNFHALGRSRDYKKKITSFEVHLCIHHCPRTSNGPKPALSPHFYYS